MNNEEKTNIENNTTNSINSIPGVKIAPVENNSFNSSSSFNQPSDADSLEEIGDNTSDLVSTDNNINTQGDSNSQENEAIKPSIAPTVTTSQNYDLQEEIVEEKSNITSAVEPDYERNQVKDFVVRSKKDEVAIELQKREKIIEEHVKTANANYKPNSKFTNFVLFVFLIGLVGFIIFLPDINEYFLLKESEKNNVDTVVRNGILKCEYEKTSDNLDYEITYKFEFTKEKVSGYSKITDIRGSLDIDEDKIDLIESDCETVSKLALDFNGLEVNCTRENLSFSKEEIFDLGTFTVDSITADYSEAGGETPIYKNNDKISDIEKALNASGASCERLPR